MGIDKIDKEILGILLSDSRLSARQIAIKLGLSTVTIISRMKRMEKEKTINGYTAILDHQKTGYDLTAIIEVKSQKNNLAIKEKLGKIDNVCGIYDITGVTDFMIVAKFEDRNDLSHFVKKLSGMDNIENTITHIVLNTIKEDFRFI